MTYCYPTISKDFSKKMPWKISAASFGSPQLVLLSVCPPFLLTCGLFAAENERLVPAGGCWLVEDIWRSMMLDGYDDMQQHSLPEWLDSFVLKESWLVGWAVETFASYWVTVCTRMNCVIFAILLKCSGSYWLIVCIYKDYCCFVIVLYWSGSSFPVCLLPNWEGTSKCDNYKQYTQMPSLPSLRSDSDPNLDECLLFQHVCDIYIYTYSVFV